MKYYPFRIVGAYPRHQGDERSGRMVYLGGARTREAAEKRARGYTNSKQAIRKWAPFRVLTDQEYQQERAASGTLFEP